MSRLALNLLLAIVWVFLHAEFSFGHLVAGFVLGFLVIALVERALGGSRYARAASGVVALAWAFAWELVLSSLALSRDVLRRRPGFHPAFIRLGVSGMSDVQMVLLANLISLTPGTLTVDADPEERAVYVHSLYVSDPAALRARLRVFVDLIQRAAGREQPSSPVT